MALQDCLWPRSKACAGISEVFWLAGEDKGNHITLTHSSIGGVTLSIPNHKEGKRRLLHDQIKRAGITDEKYREMF